MASSDQTKEDSTAMEFKRFDIVSDVSDHHYRNSNQSKNDICCFTNVNDSVHKKIMKEWRMLANNLPDSIYVRAYETRIDLLRAVIIGPSGTPYHDGLFFFDIAFPTDYPNRPPQVYYHSHGLRLNPNLYASGKVCLSLINTWPGSESKSEIWMPTTSTILQLLVSIQGLVLNDAPYFNEPVILDWRTSGYKRKKSLAYSKDVFILSCKTMMYNWKQPPKNFESFVAEHFRSRGKYVLEAIEAYSNGSCIVGQYVGEKKSSSFPTTRDQSEAEFYSFIYKDFKKMVTGTSAPGIKNLTPTPTKGVAEASTTTSKAQEIAKKPAIQNLTPTKGVAKASTTTSKAQEIAKKPKDGAWKWMSSVFKWSSK